MGESIVHLNQDKELHHEVEFPDLLAVHPDAAWPAFEAYDADHNGKITVVN